MKAFESNNRSNLVRRETVTAGERAADIRSRISGWGNFAESNGYQVCTDKGFPVRESRISMNYQIFIVLLFLVVNRGKPRGWFAYGWLVNHGLPLAI